MTSTSATIPSRPIMPIPSIMLPHSIIPSIAISCAHLAARRGLFGAATAAGVPTPPDTPRLGYSDIRLTALEVPE